MNRKMRRAAAAVLLMGTALLGWMLFFSRTPHIAADEIGLQIQLDLQEDIGLLIVNYDAAGVSGSGGTSNADKSMLKKDERMIYTLSRRELGDPLDASVQLSLQFEIITEYFDPNYDNLYPTEYTKPMNTISLEACFGELYSVVIQGERTNGYTASMISTADE